MSEKKARAQWGSKLGFILATAGSAVGLGNIWKVPGRAYEGGGASYVIIYLCIVLFIGIPVMLTELSLGRKGQADCVSTFKKLDKRFAWVGWLAIIVPFIITAYYAHVGGWVLKYFVSYLYESKTIYADPTSFFYGMLGYDAATGETWLPVSALVFGAIFMAITAFVVVKGVDKGIEKFNKVGMPALFILLIILLIRTSTLPGAEPGLKYMLHADWSKVSFATVLSALGQAFYSLSLGMGIMMTYGSYLKKDENIERSSIIVCCTDTLVALTAGFMIIPACFATLGEEGIGKGAGFAFVSLAGVFEDLPVGWLFGAIFYLLLLFAALTSCISLLEVLTTFLHDHMHVDRKKGAIVTSIVLYFIGCLYTCSQAAFNIKGIWFDFANGLTFPTFGDFMEFSTDRLLMPICALGIAIFAGWVVKPEAIIAEVRNGASFKWAKVYAFFIKFIVPIAIATIIIVGLVQGTSLS